MKVKKHSDEEGLQELSVALDFSKGKNRTQIPRVYNKLLKDGYEMIQTTKSNEREKLFLLIVRKRSEMIRLANSNGLSSNETISCSQELDSLLNSFKKFQKTYS